MRHPTTLLLTVLLAACGASPETFDPTALDALGIRDFARQSDIFTAGQLTEDQFRKATELGVSRFISLRVAAEDGSGWEEALAKEIGADFVRIEVRGEDGLTDENVRRLADAMEGVDYPMVYCGSSNRVGALLALKAYMLDGLSKEESLARGKACGVTRLEAATRKRMGM